GADAGQIIARLRREFERAILSDEQADSEFVLQPLDLMADRGLGDVQLACGLGEAQVPRGRLERPQAIERRQPRSHRPVSPYMTLFHPKRYKVSFVERRV